MEWLKEFLGDELYLLVEKKIGTNANIKLVNLADGGYVSIKKYEAHIGKKNKQISQLKERIKFLEDTEIKQLKLELSHLRKYSEMRIKVLKLNPYSEDVIWPLIDTKSLYLDSNDQLIGLDDQLEMIKQKYCFLFHENTSANTHN